MFLAVMRAAEGHQVDQRVLAAPVQWVDVVDLQPVRRAALHAGMSIAGERFLAHRREPLAARFAAFGGAPGLMRHLRAELLTARETLLHLYHPLASRST